MEEDDLGLVVARCDLKTSLELLEKYGARDFLLYIRTVEVKNVQEFAFFCKCIGFAATRIGARRSRPGIVRDALNDAWRIGQDFEFHENILALAESVSSIEPEIAATFALKVSRSDKAPASLDFLYRITTLCFMADFDLTQCLLYFDTFFSMKTQLNHDELDAYETTDDDKKSSSKPPWSPTGIARLLARLDALNALPKVYTKKFYHSKLCLVAIFLCSDSSHHDAKSIAYDGAFLLRRHGHFCQFPHTALTRALRIATLYLSPQARAQAQAAIRNIFQSLDFSTAQDMLQNVLFHSKELSHAPGLDCLRILLLRHTKYTTTQISSLDTIAAQQLNACLDSLIQDGQLGYDALHAHLEIHNATLTLSRLILLLSTTYPLSLKSIQTRLNQLLILCQTLQRRLRRTKAAPRLFPPTASDTKESSLESIAISTSIPDPPCTQNDETSLTAVKEEHRYLLHLLAENLDYLLQDLSSKFSTST